MSSPWKFKDPAKELQFHEFLFPYVVDRYNLLLRWFLVCIGIINAAATLWLIFFDEGDFGQYVGISARLSGNIASTFLTCINWSDKYKPIVGKVYMWFARIFFVLVGAVEAGLKQPDSKLKVGLLGILYIKGVFIPTYEEYLTYAIIVSYLELCQLLIYEVPCPVDSSRQCTTYELWERFTHHTLYLGIAAWIQYHTNCDRRRDFLKKSRKGATDTPKTQRESKLEGSTRNKNTGLGTGEGTEESDGCTKEPADAALDFGAQRPAEDRRREANAPAWDEAGTLALLFLAVRPRLRKPSPSFLHFRSRSTSELDTQGEICASNFGMGCGSSHFFFQSLLVSTPRKGTCYRWTQSSR
jgi:hypothetical protein